MFAWPIAFFQHLHGGQFVPLDLATIGRPRIHNGDIAGRHQFRAWHFVFIQLGAIAQQHQVSLDALDHPIFGKSNVFLGNPFGIRITRCAGAEVRTIVGIWVLLPKILFGHYAGD